MLINQLFKCLKEKEGEIQSIEGKLGELQVISEKDLRGWEYGREKEEVIGLLEDVNEVLDQGEKVLWWKQDELGIEGQKGKMRGIVVFYEEVGGFVMNLRRKEEKKKYDSLIKKLILKGRSGGIKVVL